MTPLDAWRGIFQRNLFAAFRLNLFKLLYHLLCITSLFVKNIAMVLDLGLQYFLCFTRHDVAVTVQTQKWHLFAKYMLDMEIV